MKKYIYLLFILFFFAGCQGVGNSSLPAKIIVINYLENNLVAQKIYISEQKSYKEGYLKMFKNLKSKERTPIFQICDSNCEELIYVSFTRKKVSTEDETVVVTTKNPIQIESGTLYKIYLLDEGFYVERVILSHSEQNDNSYLKEDNSLFDGDVE